MPKNDLPSRRGEAKTSEGPSGDVQEFTIHIPDAALADMYDRLRRTRFPRDYANENWEYGFPTSYLRDVVDYWLNGYDWRQTEQAMNAMASHYKTTIDGVPIHFLVKKGTWPKPVPLLLHHGWPWTFWDLRKVMGPLADPAAHGGNAADSFDVVLISLPGFGFSTPLTKTGVNFHTTADLEHTLMKDILGYQKYATAGGDWGALIAEQHGHKYEQDVIGVYTHLPIQLSHYQATRPDVPPGIAYNHAVGIVEPSEYGPDEKGWYERGQLFIGAEGGYGAIQLTRPQTLGESLNDSPAGQLAWVGEKRYFWGLPTRGPGIEALEKVHPEQDLVTNASIYYLTQTATSSARYYRECILNSWKPSHNRFPVVGAPTAVSIYLGEIFINPRKWTEKYVNLQQYRVHEKGGHFAPVEVPDIYVDDIRTFFAKFR